MKSNGLLIIKKIFLTTFVQLILFSVSSMAYVSNPVEQIDDELVTNISKFLSRQNNIGLLKLENEVYGFNIRITIEKKHNDTFVSDIISTDNIGLKIFPDYLELKKFNYKKLLGDNKKIILVIPVLILNNPTDERNPDDSIKKLNKKSITDLISALLYPNLLQENIALFPLFIINRANVR